MWDLIVSVPDHYLSFWQYKILDREGLKKADIRFVSGLVLLSSYPLNNRRLGIFIHDLPTFLTLHVRCAFGVYKELTVFTLSFCYQ